MLAIVVLFCLVVAVRGGEVDENCRRYRAATCIDDRGLTCNERNDLNSCAEELLKSAKDCTNDVKNTLSARVKSLQFVLKAACGDKDLQKAFSKPHCWQRTAKCVVGMMLKPLTYDKKKPPPEDCRDAIGGLNSCAFINRGDCDDGIIKKLVDKVKKDIPCKSSVAGAFSFISLVILAVVVKLWN